MKRIVLFVEGEGEKDAALILVKRMLTELGAWQDIILDEEPFRVGGVGKVVKGDASVWKQKLAASLKRRNVGGVLLLLDGDVERIGAIEFCAATFARDLARHALTVNAGSTFSVAVVFARQEFESWLIAGWESLRGKKLPDGSLCRSEVVAPIDDLEVAPRDAKGWINKSIDGGYRPTVHQAELVRLVDLDVIRSRQMRSFKRFESALRELVQAIQTGCHVASPSER